MPAKGKVSLPIQTIFCLIPILDVYAAYRVKKLRKYLVIMILIIGVPVSIASSVFLPIDDTDMMESFTNTLIFYYGVDDDQFIFSVGVHIGTILFAIFLIRRWSNQWNENFANSTESV